jgi:2-dehydropantoate 2-reductase
MRIAVMGAGAIGSVVGGLLTEAGVDVTLLDQWPAHVEALKSRGLRLSGTSGERVIPVRALHLHEAQAIQEPFDAVFLAVKGYDTEWAAVFAARFLREPGGVMVDFQNGINDERVAAVAGRHRTLGCVITIGAGLYEPGHAVRTDPVRPDRVCFKIGELDGRETERARRLADVMTHVGLAQVTTNLMGERWSKLATNAMANPLAGLGGYPSRQLRLIPAVRRLAIRLAAEVAQVAWAAGYDIAPIGGIPAGRYVDAARGDGLAELEAEIASRAVGGDEGRPSLLQDVMRGRRTEVADLNGLVVAEGRRLGVPTPFNEAVVREVTRHGVGTLVPDPANLQPLFDML